MSRSLSTVSRLLGASVTTRGEINLGEKGREVISPRLRPEILKYDPSFMIGRKKEDEKKLQIPPQSL